ncbi:response regulator transcription factor [Halorussus marinus]|uniref:response regulator transcription factor n=1 Tax=Halorussus marinus TaxID=2505976 RepID=UPI00106E1179|nr:response regulator [Halorussus marinus]
MSDTTVLVVDDDRPLADGFTAHLSSHFEVRTAYTGEAALDRLDEAVDVVLLDRGLPDTRGDAVLEAIRASDVDCRIAMVSGEQPSADLDCDAYLTKPLSAVDALSATVTELVDGSDTSR